MQNNSLLHGLPNYARELLGRLLDEALLPIGGATAPKFRSDNYSMIEVLDEMESRKLIRKIDNRYVVAVIALCFIDTDAARKITSSIEKLYGVLRERYKASQEEPVPVPQLASAASVSMHDAVIALPLMLENSLWWSGCSTDLTKADAFVTPSEGVLKYETFKSVEDQIRKWNTKASPIGRAENPLAPAPPPKDQPMDSVIPAWPAIRACLQEFSFYDIKGLAGLAGLDVTVVAHLVQQPKDGATKGQLMSAIDGAFGKMSSSAQTRFLTILIEEILRNRPASQERLSEYLSRLGWSFTNQLLVPLNLLNPQDLVDMPEESHRDLLKAAGRFRDGDLSGAISGACGAVDSATALVYQQKSLGDPTKVSFQERCKRAAQAKGVLTELDQQLQSLGWEQVDINPFRKNLEGALNQGAYVMQTLRSGMGDVHGSKPILRSLVFDCLRWAELIVGSLVERRDK